MALTVGDRTVSPLTADQVMAMLDAGIIPEDNRLELLAGVLTEKPVKSPAHATVKNRIAAWLTRTVEPGRGIVRTEDALAVPDPTYLPEPDVAVVPASTQPDVHPTTALLVVELEVSSVGTDRDKARHYAAARVPEYWLVDVGARRVERSTEPGDDGYRRRTVHAELERLSPVVFEIDALDLEALFADLPRES